MFCLEWQSNFKREAGSSPVAMGGPVAAVAERTVAVCPA